MAEAGELMRFAVGCVAAVLAFDLGWGFFLRLSR